MILGSHTAKIGNWVPASAKVLERIKSKMYTKAKKNPRAI
jgi:cytochrome b